MGLEHLPRPVPARPPSAAAPAGGPVLKRSSPRSPARASSRPSCGNSSLAVASFAVLPFSLGPFKSPFARTSPVPEGLWQTTRPSPAVVP